MRKTPMIILGILMFIDFCIALSKHGEPRGEYDAGASLLGKAISIGLIYWMMLP